MYGPPQSPGSWGPPPPPAWGHFPPPPPPAPVHDPAASKGNLAMGLSIAGFLLCCAPVGIAGVVLGVQSLRMARTNGSPTPVGAVLGIVLGALSIFTFLAGGMSVWKTEHTRKTRPPEIAVASDPKLDQRYLDSSTACALVEKELRKGLYEQQTSVKDVRCSGAFDVDEKRATLEQVEATVAGEPRLFTACLVRSTRWLALSVTEGGEACPSASIPPPPASRTKSEAELATEEATLRKTVADREQNLRVEAFATMIARVQDRVRATDASDLPDACPEIDLSKLTSGSYVQPSTVDFDYLATPSATRDLRDWSFMTSDGVKAALDTKRPMKERSDAVRAIVAKGGPYLVVFVTNERDWPAISRPAAGKKGYSGGTFEGSMVVVDTTLRKPICGTALKFETSETAHPGKRPSDEERMRELRENLKRSFEAASGDQLNEMSDGKLRLDGPVDAEE